MRTAHRASKEKFHPLFFWLWAITLLVILLISNSALVSLSISAGAIALVLMKPSKTYWYQSFRWSIRLATLAFTLRMAIGVMIGVPMPGRVLFTIPSITLPDLFVGIRLGGDVTSQRLTSAFNEASLLVALILIFAAASALSNPHEFLRVLPRKYYGIGLATVIASSVAPQSARSIQRVRAARRLRGENSTGIASYRKVGIPVLEESLERSIDLAASLESRGYGYFPNPSRYRPHIWRLRETIALAGPIYALIFLLLLPAVSGVLLAGLLFIAVITPGLIS
jgi:energy-coupling factor transporter transmembrane protein EcfT